MTLFGRWFFGPMERNEDNSMMEARLLVAWFTMDLCLAR